MRILIVEDDPGHALLVERALRRGGLRNEILAFEDGGELLALLEAERDAGRGEPCLVLLDLHLPRVDGFEVLRRLQADPTLQTARVVLLTTTADPEDLRRCRELGCSHYLVKPIDFDRFRGQVGELGLWPALA